MNIDQEIARLQRDVRRSFYFALFAVALNIAALLFRCWRASR